MTGTPVPGRLCCAPRRPGQRLVLAGPAQDDAPDQGNPEPKGREGRDHDRADAEPRHERSEDRLPAARGRSTASGVGNGLHRHSWCRRQGRPRTGVVHGATLGKGERTVKDRLGAADRGGGYGMRPVVLSTPATTRCAPPPPCFLDDAGTRLTGNPAARGGRPRSEVNGPREPCRQGSAVARSIPVGSRECCGWTRASEPRSLPAHWASARVNRPRRTSPATAADSLAVSGGRRLVGAPEGAMVAGGMRGASRLGSPPDQSL